MVCKLFLLSPLLEYILPQDWKILKFFLLLQGKSDRKSLTKVYHAGESSSKVHKIADTRII